MISALLIFIRPNQSTWLLAPHAHARATNARQKDPLPKNQVTNYFLLQRKMIRVASVWSLSGVGLASFQQAFLHTSVEEEGSCICSRIGCSLAVVVVVVVG